MEPYDYSETIRFRALLDANGIFWTDVEQMGKMRTCFKLANKIPIYWYADQMGDSDRLFMFCETWDVERLASELGMMVSQ